MDSDYRILELNKYRERDRIENVIAPEHVKRHHDHENKLKNEERALIEQIISHCHSFKSNFKNAAKGDWVDSAMEEIDDITNVLKRLMN